MLRFPGNTDLTEPPNAGLIGAWAFSSLNKQKAAKIARFNAWLPNADLETKARAAFAGAHIGAPDEGCRTDAQMPKAEADLANLFRSGSAHRGFVITFQPIMAPAGFSLRVPVKEIGWDGQKTKPLRTLTVMYLTRVPRSLETQRGVTEEQFKGFWQSGTPSRLSLETEKGLKEVAALLEVMAANIAPDDSIPHPWRDLPKIGPLEKAGRARCTGLPCGSVRVFRETPGLWLTYATGGMGGRLPNDVGNAVISLDADAAQFATNVWGLTLGGY